MRQPHARPARRDLVWPAALLLGFWAAAGGLWWITGNLAYLWNFLYLGVAVAGSVAAWMLVPAPRRGRARRVVMVFLGGYLFALAALTAAGVIDVFGGFPAGANVQIEGLFFALLSGTVASALVHYAVAKIAGPFLFGRIWCGWACWFGAVFDLLPYRRSPGRRGAGWGRLRYAHFALSLGLVLLLWFGAGAAQPGAWGGYTVLLWFLGGTLLYYAAGIALAVALKDNRAFCKYLCPITVPLKVGARFAVLRVRRDLARCEDEQACVKICPMDIRITDFDQPGGRVLSTECTLCQECIFACPHQALALSLGRDHTGLELLRARPAGDRTPPAG